MGFRPVWALGSTSNIQSFAPLNAVDAIAVFMERGNASQSAFEKCSDLWHAAGREVYRVNPLVGDDLNDAFMVKSATL